MLTLILLLDGFQNAIGRISVKVVHGLDGCELGMVSCYGRRTFSAQSLPEVVFGVIWI